MIGRLKVLGSLWLMIPGIAVAQDRIVDTGSIASVAALLQEAGYKAEIKKQDNGEKFISSAANGSNFSIYFYGCKTDIGCDSYEFYAFYKKKPYYTADLANEWNAKKRFLKVVIDKDGDLAEYLYVSAIGKTTYANFVDYIEWYTAMDADLSQFLQAKDPSKK